MNKKTYDDVAKRIAKQSGSIFDPTLAAYYMKEWEEDRKDRERNQVRESIAYAFMIMLALIVIGLPTLFLFSLILYNDPFLFALLVCISIGIYLGVKENIK